MYVLFYIFSFLSAQSYFDIETILKYSPIILYILFSLLAVIIMGYTVKNNLMYEKDIQSAISIHNINLQNNLEKGKVIDHDGELKL